MSPENADIFLAEDDSEKVADIRQILRGSGHRVLIMADNRRQAIGLAERLQPGLVQIALIDSNLSSNLNGQDAEDIIQRIHEQDPEVKIIGISYVDRVESADIQIVNDFDNLPNLIDEL